MTTQHVHCVCPCLLYSGELDDESSTASQSREFSDRELRCNLLANGCCSVVVLYGCYTVHVFTLRFAGPETMAQKYEDFVSLDSVRLGPAMQPVAKSLVAVCSLADCALMQRFDEERHQLH